MFFAHRHTKITSRADHSEVVLVLVTQAKYNYTMGQMWSSNQFDTVLAAPNTLMKPQVYFDLSDFYLFFLSKGNIIKELQH